MTQVKRRRRRIPPLERAVQRILVGDGCWLWLGATSGGYGVIGVNYRADGYQKTIRVHRLLYEALVGPIEDGKELDHLCRVRRCCNPSHVRQATPEENMFAPGSQTFGALNAQKTHCPKGHPYDEVNTYWRKDRPGHRECRACLSTPRRRRESVLSGAYA